MITVTFEPGTKLDPEQLEEAVREVDFTPTGVRAWIQGRVLEESPPTGAPPGALVFEATGSGQRFVVAADPDASGAPIDALRGAAGVHTIRGRSTTLDGVDEIIIYLEGTGEPQ